MNSNKSKLFTEKINEAYQFKGNSFVLGGAILNKETQNNCFVKIPLKTINRHGLISGATGTGKTKTLQLLSEKLSESGVPVLLMDVKGDLSGLAMASNGHPKIDERMKAIGYPWQGKGYPVELLSISSQEGVRLRATITEFGPILLSKVLNLNDTQQGILALTYKYCDDFGLPLLDLDDLKKVLLYLSENNSEEFTNEYGGISKVSVGAILRRVIELEQQGAELFFGEKSFEVTDLLRKNKEGLGYLNILRLTDIQDKPKLFSAFMLSLLAEVYEQFPEKGDAEKPELVIFIDEAHLIFENATKELLQQIETIIKLIRSKGVGIYFCTQLPTDIPEDVLSQLGLKIQHALRAFTAKDRKNIKMVAQNYPITEDYQVETILTELGIGEALVTALNEKGIPTPLVHTMLCAPQSRMDVINDTEKKEILDNSLLKEKYNKTINKESAYEILNRKIEEKADEIEEKKQSNSNRRPDKSTFDKIASHSLTKIIVRELTRGVMGVLGLKKRR